VLAGVDRQAGCCGAVDSLAVLQEKRAKVPHFRIYDLRSTYATRLSAGGWPTNG
jgi:integrase